MSNRLSDGARVNQWAHPIESGATVTEEGGVVRSKGKRPSHRQVNGKPHTKAKVNGDENQSYLPPAIANPGNAAEHTYTASEVAKLLEEHGDWSSHKVGGGLMGHPLAHENEAPYPLDLASFFVRSFCPPNGIVADCFSGSGTTLHAALLHGRRFIGCDVRQSQVDLSIRRAERAFQPKLEQEK